MIKLNQYDVKIDVYKGGKFSSPVEKHITVSASNKQNAWIKAQMMCSDPKQFALSDIARVVSLKNISKLS